MRSALEIANLTAGYGRTEVLHGMSLRVAEGEMVALIGANGAGKSTLLNAVMGAVKVWSGSVELGGVALTGLSPNSIVRKGITLVPERRQLFGEMTVEENLLLGAYCLPGGRTAASAEMAAQFELFPRLGERRQQLARSLSGGEQQMLAIARARMARPRVLLLDEPSLGLAPIMSELIMSQIADLRRTGTTILLVEQNARAALEIADRAYVIETGRIVRDAPARDLVGDPLIAEAYLGGAVGSLESRIRARAARIRSPSPHG